MRVRHQGERWVAPSPSGSDAPHVRERRVSDFRPAFMSYFHPVLTRVAVAGMKAGVVGNLAVLVERACRVAGGVD